MNNDFFQVEGFYGRQQTTQLIGDDVIVTDKAALWRCLYSLERFS